MTDLIDENTYPASQLEENSTFLSLNVNVGIVKTDTELSVEHGEIETANTYLVVRIDIARDKVWLINHEKPPTFPFSTSYKDLLNAIDDNTLELIEVHQDLRAYMALDDLSEKGRKKALERYEVIKPLLDNYDDLFMNHRTGDLILKTIKESNRSAQFVYDVLNAYFYYGQRIAALALPIGKSIHAESKAKNKTPKKLGRPNIYGDEGKALVEYDLKAMDYAYRRYNVKNGPTMEQAHEKMLINFYRLKKVKLSKQEQLIAGRKYKYEFRLPTEYPSINQLRRHFDKKGDGLIPVRDRNRSNDIDRKKDRAGRTGNAHVECNAFGQVFEIDETPLDEELVSIWDVTRTRKIGKATLYFVVDRFTKYIVAVYITTENPSFNTIRQAILLAATDKTEFLESLGFNSGEISWQYYGVPSVIFVDNAEFKNKVSEGAVFDLQTTIKFARPGRGDDKPNVEKMFDSFSKVFRGISKAHQTKSISDISAQLARKHACLTIRELYIIAVIFINYRNNTHLVKDFPKDQSMLLDNVEAVPAKLCEWSEIYRPGYVVEYPKHELYRKLMPKGEVSVHREGIHLLQKGLRYNCDYMLASGYQDQKLNRNKAYRFPCRYSESLVDFIYIDTPDGLQIAELDSRDRRFLGMSFYEVRLLKIQEKKEARTHEHNERGYRAYLTNTLESFINRANSMKQDSPMPDISTIKENRYFESMVNRFSDVHLYLQAINDSIDNEDEDIEDDED
ncbi:Transposon Tn7 transposition protein TnsB [Marinomonas aquimarina]|uniref:Transposon Tn7 transposition protein TnsB n=1 Tax=Marinomonas aquimarina TaxID=295068 RepID=A0A1A8T8Z8_9GAMM|nr:DDE-type integrase/transposase/recombinase [Marinomonas aquimarina]SBS28406.1 Transposon Tn7 transposition protein TnsB [Marinomonas aquimarina]